MSENMEKKTNNIRFAVGFLAFGLLWMHRPVRGGHRAAHPEGEVAAASAYLRFRGLILTQHHAAQLYPRCGYTIPAVTTTPRERTHGKERNMSQPDTDTAAQSPSSQQEPQIQTDGRRSHSEQMNQPAQTSQSESSHDGKDEHALHTNLKRGMESRHLQMISLGGVIGTGLFLSSGYTIQQAGPIGTILAYSIGALIVYLVMLTLGELSVAMPVTGSFHVYAEKFIGPGTGFVIAIQYWLTWTVGARLRIHRRRPAHATLVPGQPHMGVSAACIILIFTLNALSVRLFAEAEFWFASIKVFAICAFIVIGSLAIFGVIPVAGYQHAPMFGNLIKDGVFPNGFMPVFATILTVNFAFSGTELIGVTAGETEGPAKPPCRKPSTPPCGVWCSSSSAQSP